MESTNDVVVALFHRAEDAKAGYELLRAEGISESDLNLVMSDETRARTFVEDAPIAEASSTPPPPAASQGVLGMIATAAGAALGAGIGTLAMSGVGTVAGAATGGSIGAAVGFNANGASTKETQAAVAAGAVLLGAKLPARKAEHMVRELRRLGASQITNETATI